MELRWLIKLKEQYDGHGNYEKPILQYRSCAFKQVHEGGEYEPIFGEWIDVPIVYSDNE
jgi:hypothetical protein